MRSFLVAVALVSILGSGAASGARELGRDKSDARIARTAQRSTQAASIAFARFPPVGDASLFTVTPDGSRVDQLLGLRDTFLTEPAWSPDGGRLVFVRTTRSNVGGIFIWTAKSGGVRRLTRVRSSPSSPVLDAHPRWAPDGQVIAFHRYRDTGSTLYTVRPDGGDLRTLGEGFEPSWSPDGRRIVFASKRMGTNWDLYTVPRNGGARLRVTSHRADENNPAWSPDGRTIVFERTWRRNTDVYVMRSDGSSLRRLTRGPAADVDPVWSSDGRRIVYASRRGAGFDLYVMNADGTGKRRLTYLLGDEVQPAWAP